MANMASYCADVCVIGGGPAGSAAALRLTALGHSVVLIEKQAFPRPHVGESLVPAILPLLDNLGVRIDVEQAGFLRPAGALVRWANALEYRKLIGSAGFQVTRAKFDSLLLGRAAAAGVRIVQPVSELSIARSRDEGYLVAARSGTRSSSVRCRVLINAAGRRSPLGRRRKINGATTIAMFGYWKECRIDGPETRIDSGPEEWFWGAPLPEGLFNATVFIDPERYRNKRQRIGAGHESFYRELLGGSHLLVACSTGKLVSPVATCDATSVSAEDPITNDSLAVGEACCSVDPLSSQGVQLAIGSALHAATVIHTWLEHPTDKALASQFYCQRQRKSVDFHATAAAQFYAKAAAVYATQFWMRRSGRGAIAPAETHDVVTPNVNEDSVVVLRPGLGFKNIAVVRGDFIVSRRALCSSDVDAAVATDEAAQMLMTIDRPLQCKEVLRRWNAWVPYSQAEHMLQTCLRRRILIRCEELRASPGEGVSV